MRNYIIGLLTATVASFGFLSTTAFAANSGFTCPAPSQVTLLNNLTGGYSDFNSGGQMPSSLKGDSLGWGTSHYWEGTILGSPKSKTLTFAGVTVGGQGGVSCAYLVGNSYLLQLMPGNGGQGYTFTLSNGKSSSGDIKTIITPTKN